MSKMLLPALCWPLLVFAIAYFFGLVLSHYVISSLPCRPHPPSHSVKLHLWLPFADISSVPPCILGLRTFRLLIISLVVSIGAVQQFLFSLHLLLYCDTIAA